MKLVGARRAASAARFAAFLALAAALLSALAPAPASGQQQQQQCSAGTKFVDAGGGGALVDLTVPVRAGLPVWNRADGLPRSWRALSQSQAEGDVVNQSHLNLDAHTGTHIDAPAHFLADGAGIDALPLDALVGAAHIVEIPQGNVTAAALAAAGIPPTAERLLFRTLNTARKLMGRTEFAPDYVGLDSGAAKWLAKERPRVRLVGIDYLSIGMLEDIVEAHKALFRANIVVVEGLDLGAAPSPSAAAAASAAAVAGAGPGLQLACLPLLLAGSDGAPARCVLSVPPIADGEQAGAL